MLDDDFDLIVEIDLFVFEFLDDDDELSVWLDDD